MRLVSFATLTTAFALALPTVAIAATAEPAESEAVTASSGLPDCETVAAALTSADSGTVATTPRRTSPTTAICMLADARGASLSKPLKIGPFEIDCKLESDDKGLVITCKITVGKGGSS